MNTTAIGRRAEIVAAKYLEQQGYRIVCQNWRTRWCEIDLVATKGRTVSFVEVKYRRRSNWGSGLDYITSTKQRQMAFAAEFWVATYQWPGEMYLAVIEVSGPKYAVTTFMPEL